MRLPRGLLKSLIREGYSAPDAMREAWRRVRLERDPERPAVRVQRKRHAMRRTFKGNPSSAYDVFLREKKIDTVFQSDPSSAEEVKRSLVEHDGYDPDIRVVKQRRKPRKNPGAAWHRDQGHEAMKSMTRSALRGEPLKGEFFRGQATAHQESEDESRRLGLNPTTYAEEQAKALGRQYVSDSRRLGYTASRRGALTWFRGAYPHFSKKREHQAFLRGFDEEYEKVYGRLSENPGAAWHEDQERMAEAMEKRETRPRQRTYLKGTADAHRLSAHESKKMGLNPRKSEADETAARELLVFIESTESLYRQMYMPIVRNMLRKMQAGTYDRAKAVQGFLHLADEGAKRYNQEVMGERGIPAFFTKATRLLTAESLRDRFEDDARTGYYKENPRGARTVVGRVFRAKRWAKRWARGRPVRRVKGGWQVQAGRKRRLNPDVEMTFNTKAKAMRYASAMRKLGHDIEVVKGQYGTYKTIIRETRKNPIAVYNPPPGRLIYGRVLTVEAQKTNGSHKGKRFRHSFAGDSRVAAYALPDGSVLLKSAAGKRLWADR